MEKIYNGRLSAKAKAYKKSQEELRKVRPGESMDAYYRRIDDAEKKERELGMSTTTRKQS